MNLACQDALSSLNLIGDSTEGVEFDDMEYVELDDGESSGTNRDLCDKVINKHESSGGIKLKLLFHYSCAKE